MASGDTLCRFMPQRNEPPAASYGYPARRNGQPILTFGQSVDSYAIFRDVLPRNYAGGGITVYIYVTASTATTGNTYWEVSFERIGTTQDVDSDSFATGKNITITVSATNGIPVEGSVAFSNGSEIDSVAAGELFRVKVGRKGTSGSDTMTSDAAQLHAVELKET